MSENGDMDSEEDNGDMEMEEFENLDEQIQSVRSQISRQPYDLSLREKLIELLRRNCDLDELKEARSDTSKIFPLTADMYIQWINDERSQDADQQRLEDLFNTATSDTGNILVWVEYVQWASGLGISYAREKFELALQSLGLRVNEGGLIWESYIDLELAHAAGLDRDDEAAIIKQKSIVIDLFKRALRVPTSDLSSIWQRYIEFAGSEDSDVKSIYENSQKMLDKRGGLEIRLLQTDNSLDIFAEYLQIERETDDPARIQSLYERMVYCHLDNADLWLEYGGWCESKLKVHNVTCNVYKRAVRHCPYSCPLWQETLLAMERANTSANEIDSIWKQAVETISNTADGRSLYRTYLYLLRRRASASDNDFGHMAIVFDEGAKFLEENFGKEWDTDAEYRRNHAYFAFDRLEDIEKGRKIWEDILASGGGRLAERWIEAVNLERRFGNTITARKLLYKALNSVSDYPMHVFTYIIQFEREEGTIEQLEKAIEKVNSQRTQRDQRAAKKEESERKKAKPDIKGVKKDMTITSPNDRKRMANKPHVDTPIPKKPTTSRISTSPDASVPRLSPPVFPVIKDKDGFAMPSLPVIKPATSTKPTEEANVSSPKQSSDPQKYTVFVSNLDFKISPDKIKEVLDGVVEVRLIYRGMSKLHKGYGYVDLDSEENMRAALKKDRIPIDGRPMLVSENNPEKRAGFKYETGKEKKKLYVKNVDFDSTEEQVKAVFEQFGVVNAVRIVTHKSGKSKGCAFVEFDTEESAEKAVNHEGLVLRDRVLSVAISNPPPPKKSSDNKWNSSTEEENIGGRIGHSSKLNLSMVPRIVKKATIETKSLSNDQFRKFLNGK